MQDTSLPFIKHRGVLLSCAALLSGLLWIGLLAQPVPMKGFAALVWVGLLYGAAADWRDGRIPWGPLVVLLVLGAGYSLLTGQRILHWGLGPGLVGLCMGLLYVMSRRAISLHDVLILTVLGIFLGPYRSFCMVFHASWIGALTVLTGLAIKRLDRHQRIPFTPFIAIGYLLALSSL